MHDCGEEGYRNVRRNCRHSDTSYGHSAVRPVGQPHLALWTEGMRRAAAWTRVVVNSPGGALSQLVLSCGGTNHGISGAIMVLTKYKQAGPGRLGVRAGGYGGLSDISAGPCVHRRRQQRRERDASTQVNTGSAAAPAAEPPAAEPPAAEPAAAEHAVTGLAYDHRSRRNHPEVQGRGVE